MFDSSCLSPELEEWLSGEIVLLRVVELLVDEALLGCDFFFTESLFLFWFESLGVWSRFFLETCFRFSVDFALLRRLFLGGRRHSRFAGGSTGFTRVRT